MKLERLKLDGMGNIDRLHSHLKALVAAVNALIAERNGDEPETREEPKRWFVRLMPEQHDSRTCRLASAVPLLRLQDEHMGDGEDCECIPVELAEQIREYFEVSIARNGWSRGLSHEECMEQAALAAEIKRELGA